MMPAVSLLLVLAKIAVVVSGKVSAFELDDLLVLLLLISSQYTIPNSRRSSKIGVNPVSFAVARYDESS